MDWRESYESLKTMTRWGVQRHVHFAHNTFDMRNRLYQPGEVAILSLGLAAAKVLAMDMDETGLGRWCSVQYQLKASRLWVIVVYRPCVTMGPDTVYQQHIRRLSLEEVQYSPRDSIVKDLERIIAKYKEDGSLVIVGGDFNDDIRQLRIQGVREVTSRFYNGPTYERGSAPIDGFYTSHTLPITGGGALPFYTACSSNHTAVWMSTSVFQASKVAPHRIRRLQVTNRKCVSRYLDYIRPNVEEDMTDEQFTALLVKSEAICRRVYTGGLVFSPELSKALVEVRLWRLRIKRKDGGRVDTSLLIRLEQRCGLVDGPLIRGMTKEELEAGLTRARDTMKAIRQIHQQLRFSYLQQRALSKPELESMIDRERVRNVYKRLREAIPSKTKRPLFMVMDLDGSWKDTPDDIFLAVAEENVRRFTQTHDTPLRVAPLRQILGDRAETEAVDAILSGTFVAPDGVDPYFTQLLPFLRRPPEVVDLDLFQAPSFMTGWRKIKETTGCQGPFHFGHFKALASDTELSQWAASRLRDSFYSGAPPNRWRSGTDIMLEKKPGVYNVDKLRTILLFQPDFNFGNKAIGRGMMTQAESLHLIPEAQYGSRHGKSASQQLLNKVCLFELSRIQCVSMGYCSTDAKSCYDRIVHSFATLALRRWGVPKQVAITMFDVVSSMVHLVQWGFGESTQSYSHPINDPFQGVGQGNGAGPAIWTAVSAPLLEFLESRGRGVVFQSPISRERFSISSLALVDDTDVVSGIPEDAPMLDENIIQVLSSQVKDWEGAVRVTGGALVPEKSFYWLLNNTNGILSGRTSGPNILVRDSEGHEGAIPFISLSESRRTLGVLINPLGTWTEQRNKMRASMEKWIEASRVANLSRNDAMVELKTRVLPQLLYGLEATSFHHRDCKYIMAPALKIGLNLCGVVRTLPRPIVFGPADVLGLGIEDIYVFQGIKYLQALTFYGPMDPSRTGQLIRSLMGEAMIKVGMGSSVLAVDYDNFGKLLDKGWVKTLWQFCSESDIKVEDWLPSIPLLRENDQYIMAVAKQSLPHKDSSSLTSINKCRLYLKVVSLADITYGHWEDGNGID